MARRLGSLLRAWLDGERGNIAAVLAILIVPIAGAMALATETGVWYVHQRAEQRAADAAVVAASIASEGGSSASAQAATVATSYGYTDDGGDVRVQTFTACPTGIGVTVSCTGAGCPTGTSAISGSSNCVWVYIKRKIPIYLTRVVGYQGDTTLASGQAATTTYALAAAGVVTGAQSYCVGTKTGFTVNGGSQIDWNGCSASTGGDMACNGSNGGNADTGMPFGDAAGSNGKGAKTSNSCGQASARSNIPWTDALAAQATLAATAAKTNCTSYKSTAIPASLPSGYNCYSGPQTLSANVTASNANTVLVINGGAAPGALNFGAFKLSTSGSGSLTVIFTGTLTNTGLMTFGSGGIDIAAPLPDPSNPTSPNQGLAVVVDPTLTATGKNGTLDLTLSGSSSALGVTGAIYDINGDFKASGNISRATSSSYDCIGVWANSITVNGTGKFFTSTADCNTAGVNLPKIPIVALLQ